MVSNGFYCATIGGGGSLDYPHRVGGHYATVIGGVGNTASGWDSTAMGFYTTASGGSGAIVMGEATAAAANNTMAAGTRAKANHPGTFVRADYQYATFSATANNQFLIRATGGVGINKNNPATALDVNGTVTATAFNPPSDRNLKEKFAPVNPVEVIDKVAALPICRWNFKGDTATPHVGLMAQDFHAAFGLGTDDKHIATVDADGVALAAIQGLNLKLSEELKRRNTENAELKARLDKLEQLLENRL